jgi:small subunit ribosomal protein S9
MADDERRDPPENEEPTGTPEEQAPDAPEEQAPGTPEEQAPDAPEEQPADASQPEPDAPVGTDEQPAPGGDEQPAPGGDERPADERPEAEEQRQQPGRGRRGRSDKREDEVIPGEHLEPDLVLEEEREAAAGVPAELAEAELGPEAPPEPEVVEAEEPAPAPVAREPVDLAADARYQATGKRKSSVARVILKPGTGAYAVNGRALEEFFPRPTLQRVARQPLETAGYESRMDVVARIHGGGVSAQAGALRHGVARALVEADPNLRGELKRRGFLTRDPRVKERKKAGLKKARKRPQFSKR